MKAPLPSLFLGICMLWHCLPVFAQSAGSLCPNTALVPVFKQDFGQSVLSSTTSSAASGSTNYNFGGVSTDGNYIITPLVNNANKADWTKGGDHTGNTNGNMFLVNAGGGNSIFFQQTITGLCTGSSFNFSAWLANVNTSNTQTVCGVSLVYPKVIFNIKNLSGTVLGTVTTGSLPLSANTGPPNWQQYGFQFSLPVGITSLVLEMVDFYGGAAACGNDVALDDILFSACTPQASITLGSASSICSGSYTSITSTLVNSPFITPAYQWQKSIDNGVSWQNIGTASTSANSFILNNVNAADGGLYKVLVGPDIVSLSALSCITESNSIFLVVNPTPILSVSTNIPICSGSSLNFQSTVTGGTAPYAYSWIGPNGFTATQANPIIVNSSAASSGAYFLSIADANSCSANANIYTFVNQSPTLSITNNASNICSNHFSQIQFNSSLTGSSYFWNAKAIIGTATGFMSNTVGSSVNTIHDGIENTSTAPAIIRYVITATMVAGCSVSDSTEITIYPEPSKANAGSDQILCNVSSIELHANTVITGSGNWSFLSGPSSISFANAGLPITTVSGVIIGDYAFIWTTTNTMCSDSKDTIYITVLPALTTANAGVDQILCSATSTSLNANTPQSGTGLWIFLSGPSSPSFTNAFSPTTSVSGLTNGNYQFIWVITNNICTDSKDTIEITIYPPIINKIDTTQKTICSGQIISLLGEITTGGNGSFQYQWEQSKNGIKWKSIFGATGSQYSFIPDSSMLIRRLITSLPCFTTGSILQIEVQEAISENTIAGNQEICLGSPMRKITGSVPKGGGGNFVYHWEQSIDNGVHWSTSIGADSNDLILTSINQTTLFRRIVSTQICSGLQASISNAISVMIKPAPTITLQYKGGVYCSTNTPIDFTTQTTNADSIRWDFGDGIVQTFLTGKVTHQYTYSGIFLPKLRLLNTNQCTLTYTAQDTIIVDEIKAGFKLFAVYDCGRTRYRFIDTSQSYFTIAKRNWLINQIPANTENEFQYTFSQAGEYLTELQLQSTTGCTNKLEAKFSVAIYNYPKANINAIGQACLNNLLELKSEINSIDSVAMLFWNLGNGTNATDSIVKVFYYSEGKYTVKLTVATINSCYDSAYKQITIHPVPKITLALNQTVCKGDSLELKADGALSYVWTDKAGTVICNNCTTAKVLPQKSMLYKVIGYSQFGCSEIGQTNVRVIQPFVINAKLSDTICMGESKRIFVSGASYYSWFPNPGLSNYNIASPYANPSITTTYKVIGKDSYNCFTDSANIRIVVGKPTTINLGRDSIILAGTSIQLQASSAVPDIKKFRWSGADFSCLNCPSPIAKIFLDKCISCVATNIYGCNSTDTICIKTFCPSSEVFIPNAFSPDGDGINDRLMIQGRGIKMIKNFRVFSRWGEIVFEKENFLPGDASSSWDGKVRGKAATPDVFVYICEVLCEKGLPATFKGNVAILK